MESKFKRMKTIIPSQKTINIGVMVLLLLFFGLIYFMFLSKPTSITGVATNSSSYDIDKLPAIDEEVPGTLPYDIYKKKTDSIRYRRQLLNETYGSSTSFVAIGALRASKTDFLYGKDTSGKKSIKLIKLHWWTLDTASRLTPTRYFVKDDKAYLRKTNCQLVKSNANGHSVYKCKETDVQVPFRYNTSNKSIMILANDQTFDILYYGILIAGAAIFVFLTYFLVGGFIQFLMEIARGTPFSDSNVKRLKRMAFILFAIPVSLFLLNLFAYLIFHSYFTSDVRMSSEIWGTLWKPAILGVIFTALYIAFRQGRKLKEEQDLTV